jgi:hypothetical protein
MPDNTVTIVLNGDVPLSEFAKAVANFNELVRALSAEAGNESLDWIIQDLQYSSALATAAAHGDEKTVIAVVSAYADVGASLESNAPIQHNERVRSAATNLVSIEDARVKSVNLETAEREATVITKPEKRRLAEVLPIAGTEAIARSAVISKAFPAFGAVEGRIQTLTNRGGLRFTLFDLLYDKAVSCYFAEGKQETIRGLWGKMAVVEGFISRDPITGRPMSIRRVANILPLPEPCLPSDYQDARGVAPSVNGLSPEAALRRIRDAN